MGDMTQTEGLTQEILQIVNEVKKVIAGKDQIVINVLCAVLAGGHVLLEDVPGVGKTTLALAFSKVLSMDYRRVQFTPDVLPSDVVGFSMFNRKINDFEYKEGAAMCNLLLADEINRTSPKTQAALLEVMEEGKVTVDGETHFLPDPFVVIATQNPVGYVGTQRLPESQLDRFMIRLSMGYPDMKSELDVYKGKSYQSLESVERVLQKERLIEMRKMIKDVHVDEKIYEYVVNITRESRNNEFVMLGISPRGGIALINMAKSMAYIHGRDYVIPEDVTNVMEEVFVHRLVIGTKAKANGYSENDVIKIIKDKIKVP